MDVSVVDLTVRLAKDASYEDIMTACRRASEGELKVEHVGCCMYSQSDHPVVLPANSYLLVLLLMTLVRWHCVVPYIAVAVSQTSDRGRSCCAAQHSCV